MQANNSKGFLPLLAVVASRYHEGMVDDPYHDRLMTALRELRLALKMLEERVGEKGKPTGEQARENLLRRTLARQIEKGRKAQKKRAKLNLEHSRTKKILTRAEIRKRAELDKEIERAEHAAKHLSDRINSAVD